MHGMIIFDSNVFRLRRNFINFASKSAISLKDPKPRYYMKSLLLAIAFMWPFHEIKAHDNLTLCYDRPADFFEEALVIGNGHLGGIVYGGTTTDRISLNDITLWTGEPDMKSVNPEAYRHLPAVRQALRTMPRLTHWHACFRARTPRSISRSETSLSNILTMQRQVATAVLYRSTRRRHRQNTCVAGKDSQRNISYLPRIQ